MKTKFRLFAVFSMMILLNMLQSCSKSNTAGVEDIYNGWTFTRANGTVTVNGNQIGASQNSNTTGVVTLQFQNDGTYHYQVKSLVDETGSFTRTDSIIHLDSDSSYLSNALAYPIVYFSTAPGETPPLQHVSRVVRIEYINHDSLLLSTQLIRPGINAPDTVYTEHTGFKK